MKRLLGVLLLIPGLTIYLGGGRAYGQIPYYRPGGVNPGLSPTVSPYLNLLRGGTAPAINYYGLVRPQFAFASELYGLQQQVNTLGQQVSAEEAAATPVSTGHRSGFMTHTRYFQTLGSPPAGGPRGSVYGARPLATPQAGGQLPVAQPRRR
jgi:hypothetical protein